MSSASDMEMSNGDGGSGFGSFHQFVSSIMPNIPSSATARIDHRTGNFTLSIGSGQAFSPQESSEMFQNRINPLMSTGGGFGGGGGGRGGSSSTTPPVHPLVMIAAEARPHRIFAHSSAGSNITAYTSRTVGSNMIATMVTNMRDPLGLQSFDPRRQIRLGMGAAPPTSSTVTRRKVGPIVSDRRWGTDVGEIEPVGGRQSVLLTAVENAMNQVIPSRQKDSIKPGRSTDYRRQRPPPHFASRSMLRSLAQPHDATANDEEDQNIFSIFDSDDDDGGDGDGEDVFYRMEESKEEGELQESKDGDEGSGSGIAVPNESASAAASASTATSTSTPSATAAVSSNDAATAAAVAYDSMDHLLDTIAFTGQCDDGSSASSHVMDESEFFFREPMQLSVGSSSSSGGGVAAEPAEVDAAPALAPAPAPASTQQQQQEEESSTNPQPAVSDLRTEPSPPAMASSTSSSSSDSSQISAAAPAGASTTAGAPAASSNENLQFVESLSGDLRQEVLLTSNEEFLATLPPRIQEEVRECL
jgi:hypothetical protein